MKSPEKYLIDPSKWPKNVHPMTWAETEGWGIDDEHVVYWNGKPIQLQKRVTLSFRQGLATFFMVTFTVIGGIGAAAQGWAAYNDWACKAQWPGIGCGASNAGK